MSSTIPQLLSTVGPYDRRWCVTVSGEANCFRVFNWSKYCTYRSKYSLIWARLIDSLLRVQSVCFVCELQAVKHRLSPCCHSLGKRNSPILGHKEKSDVARLYHSFVSLGWHNNKHKMQLKTNCPPAFPPHSGTVAHRNELWMSAQTNVPVVITN